MTHAGRPLKTAVFSAALMATLLTTGATALLLEIPDWWAPLMGGTGRKPFANGWSIFAVWSAMLIVWAGWACIFLVYWKQGGIATYKWAA